MRGSIISVLQLCCLVAASGAPRANAYNYEEVAKLTAADGASWDQFGWSVAIDGATVVIGALFENDSRGAAYVFRTTDGGATYGQVAKLTAAEDAGSEDEFGRKVAIAGDIVAVASKSSRSNPPTVYVFRTTDGGITYDRVATLTASEYEFGRSVAIYGETLVVGASLAAYVFRTTDGGATYAQVAKLTHDAGGVFGYSVAVDGDTVVVGAGCSGSPCPIASAIYVFRTTDDGATYNQVATLSPEAEFDGYGVSVAISGDTIVLGSNPAYSDEGAAYVFRASGATYVEVAKLTAADAAADEWFGSNTFGSSVAIDGDTIVIGASVVVGSCCLVYVYRTTDDGVTCEQKLTARDAGSDDNFGTSVAIDGGIIVVGAPGCNQGWCTPSPAAYVFDAYAPTSQPTQQPTPAPSLGPKDQQQQQDSLATILIPTAVAVLVLWCLYFVLTAKKKQPVPHARDGAASTDPTVPSAPPLPPLPPPSAPPHFRYREAECATPVAVQVTRPEVARPVAGTSTAPFATVVNVQRVVRGWSARGLQRLASWRATPEEEV